jgi:hypothetical protein
VTNVTTTPGSRTQQIDDEGGHAPPERREGYDASRCGTVSPDGRHRCTRAFHWKGTCRSLCHFREWCADPCSPARAKQSVWADTCTVHGPQASADLNQREMGLIEVEARIEHAS